MKTLKTTSVVTKTTSEVTKMKTSTVMGMKTLIMFKSNYLLKKTSNQEKAIVDDHAMISLD